MLVKNWMSQPAITVNEKDSMQDATKIMKKNNISILPVLKKEILVGVITDGDLKRASASDATSLEIHELFYLISKIKIKDIMSGTPITVPPDFTVEETAEILLKNKISGVPVVDYVTGDAVACSQPFGTPVVGWLNGEAVSVQSEAWGNIKALYR